MIDFFFQNYETITLLITNLIAYILPSPSQKKRLK